MLKALMLRKKLNEANKTLEELKAKRSELETRAADIAKREAEIATAIEEAETDEEKQTVEEAVNAIESENQAIETETKENDQAITDLENEVEELERQLEETEAQQNTVAEVASEETKTTANVAIKEERNTYKMFKTRSIQNMTHAERSALVEREDVKTTLAEIRALIPQKRAVTGANLTIGETVLGLIRENVMNYSKLYSRVNVQVASGNGRLVVQGVAPEAIWLECCDAIPEVAISFGQVELDCFKVAGYFAVCNATVEDSDIDLLDTLTDALMQALGKAIDKAIVYGTGEKMPTGVVTAIAETASQLVTVPSSATGAEFFKAIIIASGKANSKYSRGVKTWIMNESTYTKLVAEAVSVDASGAIVAGVSGVMPVVGGDIVVINDIPDDNIILGYFDLYVLLERLGITIETSEHVKFIDDQTVLRGKARMDGKPAVNEAFVAIGLGTAPVTSVTFAGQQAEG